MWEGGEGFFQAFPSHLWFEADGAPAGGGYGHRVPFSADALDANDRDVRRPG